MSLHQYDLEPNEFRVPWDTLSTMNKSTAVVVLPGPAGPVGPDGSVSAVTVAQADSDLPYGFDHVTPVNMLNPLTGSVEMVQVAHSDDSWIASSGDALRRNTLLVVQRTPANPGPSTAETRTRRVPARVGRR